MLIGLTGLAGSGKSEVARVLTDECGFERVKFADPLKNMLRALLRDIGHSEFDIERYADGDLKESVVDGIGITSRRLQQSLGTAWGRALDPEFWVKVWAAKAETLARVVADDVRFPNEVEAIRAGGGQIWQIARPGVVAVNDHVSEKLECTPDRIILNDGDLGLLRQRVRHAWMTAPLDVQPGDALGFGFEAGIVQAEAAE